MSNSYASSSATTDDATAEAKPSKAIKLPAGYEDEDEFLIEARERFQQSLDADRENRDEGLEDLKFLAGDQWDPVAKALRANRPMLMENTLPQFVAQVVGDIRINRPAIKVRPAEDADKDLADVREGLIRAIERDSDAQGIYADSGQAQVACGIGNFRITLKNATDDGFDRDITPQFIPNPFAVVWDPMAVERTGRDAAFCFVQDEVPRKAFLRQWKDELPTGLEVPLHDVEGWYTRDSVRVTEYWTMQEAKALYARLDGGATVEVQKSAQDASGYALVKRKADKIIPQPLPAPIAVDEDGQPMVREGVRRWACMYLITGKAILSGPHELPIDRVPIIRVRGWEVSVGDKRVRWGLVRFARDPQRLRNYWRSIQAESLAMAPKDKWLIHEANEGDADAFRDGVDNDDNTLVWSGQFEPKRLPPPQINNAVLQEIATNTQAMKDVTGIHDASLGIQSNETSGKAINARQREGDVATYIYHDNLQAAIKEGGRLINALIPISYDTARTIRLVGVDETTKVQRINDLANPESVDINRGKYDVVVETGPSYSTKRAEASESMIAFVQAVPSSAQVAGDLIAKAQDWPMADEIAERMKRALPPQITAQPDEDMTPEEAQAKQQAAMQAQQQQQMQQHGAELQLAEAEAKVNLTNAQAAKLQAEAQMVGAPQGEQADPMMQQALMAAQVRKANADAVRAEWDAEKAQADAQRARIGIATDTFAAHADAMDLDHKPTEMALNHAASVKALETEPEFEPAE